MLSGNTYIHYIYWVNKYQPLKKNEDINTEELSKIVENLQEKVETGSIYQTSI